MMLCLTMLLLPLLFFAWKLSGVGIGITGVRRGEYYDQTHDNNQCDSNHDIQFFVHTFVPQTKFGSSQYIDKDRI